MSGQWTGQGIAFDKAPLNRCKSLTKKPFAGQAVEAANVLAGTTDTQKPGNSANLCENAVGTPRAPFQAVTTVSDLLK
jgi:hypothetical protein